MSKLIIIIIIIIDSSASGDTVIAVAASGPNEKFPGIYFSPVQRDSDFDKTIPGHLLKTSFNMVSPGQSVVGSGRNIGPVSNLEPFPFLLFMPINIDGSEFGNTASFSDWIKNIGKFYEPSFVGKGEYKSVTTINNNGHVYGKIKTVSFDKNPNSDVKIVSSESSV